MVSMGWLLGLLRPTPYDRWISPLVSLALVVEVGLITLQQWRGEPSHFNESTPFNTLIDGSITCLIILAAVVIFDLTRRCFGHLSGSKDICLAARAGMVFLTASCLIGFVILLYGQHQASLGKDPELFGKAGVMKFPHGIAIHAIQFLPILCWIMAKLKIRLDRRYQLVGWTSASIAALMAFSLIQTAGGRARFDLSLVSGMVLLFAIGLLIPLIKEVVKAIIQNRAVFSPQR